MKYKTTFFGEIIAVPPLSLQERSFLSLFSSYKHEESNDKNGGRYPNEKLSTAIGSNKPPVGQPSWWCGWISNENGNIVWNENTSFLMPVEWFVYIVEHFFTEHAFAKFLAPEMCDKYSLSSHVFNGTIYAQGISLADIWRLDVKNNEVFICRGKVFQNNEVVFPKMESIEDFKTVSWGGCKKIVYMPTNDEGISRDKNILNKKLKTSFKIDKIIKV